MQAENEQWYRTGAVAKMLDTSPHRIRALARAGVIESQVRNGYRYIPGREVERLQSEGLPQMPASADLTADDSHNDHIESGRARPSRSRAASAELYADPSPELARSAERLVAIQHEEQVRTIKRARKEEETRERRAHQIQEWRDSYRRIAAAAAHGEVLAGLLNKVDSLLDAAPVLTNLTVQVRQLIEAEMRPIREREQRERDLAAHRDRVARTVKSITQGSLGDFFDVEPEDLDEARELAHTELTVLPILASDRQFGATLQQAIAPVTKRIAHRRAQKERAREIDRRIRALPMLLNSPYGTGDRMRRDVRAMLESLSLTACEAELEAAMERVLEPFRAADQQSEVAARKQREAAAAKRAAATRWLFLLSDHVEVRVRQLERIGRLTCDGALDRLDLCRNLKKNIEPIITAEIARDPSLSDEQLKTQISALVDRQYEEFCEE